MPNLSVMYNSLNGMNAANPAATQGDDIGTRAIMEAANNLEAPVTPPSFVSPIQQFLTLFAANAGAHMLRRPEAAVPGQRAVAYEYDKPEQFRRERQEDLNKARALRLQAMIRIGDQLFERAQQQGRFDDALKLGAQNHKYEKELLDLRNSGELARDALNNKAQLGAIGARNAGDIALEKLRQAGQKEVAMIRTKQLAHKYGLTLDEAAELEDYADNAQLAYGKAYGQGVGSGMTEFNLGTSHDVQAAYDADVQAKAADIVSRRGAPTQKAGDVAARARALYNGTK
jgi:hypothetical protein